MKKLILTFVMALIGVVAYSQNVVYVNTYIKANGKVVEGHYRTEANNTVNDNFSTFPNVNPYTGEIGTKHIYDNNSYTNYNYTNNYNSYNSINYSNTNSNSSSYSNNSSFSGTNDLFKTNSLFQTNSLFK